MTRHYDYDYRPRVGPGESGNVLAAVCSFLVPGLGQLTQGRILSAIWHFVLAGCLWIFTFGLLGWLGHIIACIDAARWRGFY